MDGYEYYIDGELAGYYNEVEYLWSRSGEYDNVPTWITPSHVCNLKGNNIFVFGTDRQGRHSAGASQYAVKHFGAINGRSEGLQGQSYAIPSNGSLEELKEGTERFTRFAREHPELTFYITAIGCGLARRKYKEVAPMFEEASNLPNTYLPLPFWTILLHYPTCRTVEEFNKYAEEQDGKHLKELYTRIEKLKIIKNSGNR